MYSKTVYFKLFGQEISVEVMCTPDISDQELSNKAFRMLKREADFADFSVSRFD